MRASDPVEDTWRDLWLTVTPLWALLVAGRLAVHELQSLVFPSVASPVISVAVQSLLLWPLVVLGCHLTLSSWRRHGFGAGVSAALAASALLGAAARPLYAAVRLLGSSGFAGLAGAGVLGSGRPLAIPSPWYAWLSDAVEFGLLFLSCVAATLGLLCLRTLEHERRLRHRIEAAAGQERLRTLRAQLNPHFLFNTLNSIVGLSEAQSSAQTLVTRLSDLLRRTLRASESEEHPLSEELARRLW